MLIVQKMNCDDCKVKCILKIVLKVIFLIEQKIYYGDSTVSQF